MPDDQQNQNLENGNPDTSGTSTPPTTTNQDPGTGATEEYERMRARLDQQERYAQLIEEQLRVQSQTIDRLSKQPTPATSAPKPSITPEQAKSQFYNDPVKTITDVVRAELHETIKPLQDFVHNFRGQSELDKVILKLKTNPRLADQIDSFVEQTVRQMFTDPSIEVSEPIVQGAMLQVIGARAAGLITNTNGGQPAPAPQPPPPTPQPPAAGGGVIPPHMRPSNPTGGAPQGGGTTTTRQLTELEKRIARERNMSDKQYIEWLTVPADRVVTSTIGREAAK